MDVSIVYEINITNISNYYNNDFSFNGFKLNFTEHHIYGDQNIELKCHFAEYDNNPLLLLCLIIYLI